MTMIRKLVQAAISTLGPDEVEITMRPISGVLAPPNCPGAFFP